MNEEEKQKLIEQKIEALAIHLNIALEDIIQDDQDYDDEFMVKFHKKHKHQLECLTREVVKQNIEEYNCIHYYEDELTLSFYTKIIGDNDFYFRWL